MCQHPQALTLWCPSQGFYLFWPFAQAKHHCSHSCSVLGQWTVLLQPLPGWLSDLKLMESGLPTPFLTTHTVPSAVEEHTAPVGRSHATWGLPIQPEDGEYWNCLCPSSSVSWGHPGVARGPVPSCNSVLTSAYPGSHPLLCAEYFIVQWQVLSFSLSVPGRAWSDIWNCPSQRVWDCLDLLLVLYFGH